MEVDTLLGVLNGIIAFLLGLFNLSMFLYLVVLKGGS